MSEGVYFIAGLIVGAFAYWLITTKMPAVGTTTSNVIVVPARQGGYYNPFYPGSYTPPGHIIPL